MPRLLGYCEGTTQNIQDYPRGFCDNLLEGRRVRVAYSMSVFAEESNSIRKLTVLRATCERCPLKRTV